MGAAGSAFLTSVGDKAKPGAGTLASAAVNSVVGCAKGEKSPFNAATDIVKAGAALSSSAAPSAIEAVSKLAQGKVKEAIASAGSAAGRALGTAAGRMVGAYYGPIVSWVGGIVGGWLGSKVGENIPEIPRAICDRPCETYESAGRPSDC